MHGKAYHQRFINKALGDRFTHNCPSCQAPTYCAMDAGKSANLCWCMEAPKDYNVVADQVQCLCRNCLTNT